MYTALAVDSDVVSSTSFFSEATALRTVRRPWHVICTRTTKMLNVAGKHMIHTAVSTVTVTPTKRLTVGSSTITSRREVA